MEEADKDLVMIRIQDGGWVNVSSGRGSPGWSRIEGRKTVLVVVVVLEEILWASVTGWMCFMSSLYVVKELRETHSSDLSRGNHALHHFIYC